MNRTVWTFAQADVNIYREDDAGDYMDVDPITDLPLPVFTPCYLQRATVSARNPGVVRRAVTGRGRRKIIQPSRFFDEINMQIEHLFFRKSLEFNISQVFNPAQQLRVELSNFEVTYSGTAPFEQDTFQISFARSTSFSVTGQDDANMTCSAEFEAEMIL